MTGWKDFKGHGHSTLSMTARTRVDFEHIRFVQGEQAVRGVFCRHFGFELRPEELARIAPSYAVEDGALVFDAPEKTVLRRANQLIGQKLLGLKSRLSGNPAVYVDEASGIPLIGSLSFGLIDRNTNCIEVRPNTGCNLSCVFCSVGEGRSSFNATEYLAEADYLVKGLEELIAFKGCDVDVHIGCQGEPTLYSRLEELIAKVRAIPRVRNISMVTNGVLLDEAGIRALAKAGLTQLDLSINALSGGTAARLAGCAYPLGHIKKVAESAAREMGLVIAPVWVPGMNDAEMGPLIEFAKRLGARIGIQNYLPYRFGRKPVKAMPMPEFEERMRSLEKKHGCKLVFGPADFNIMPTKPLPKPFRRGEAVEAELLCPGRRRGEMLAAAGGRVITVTGCRQDSGRVRMRITRSKHNIFYGKRL